MPKGMSETVRSQGLWAALRRRRFPCPAALVLLRPGAARTVKGRAPGRGLRLSSRAQRHMPTQRPAGRFHVSVQRDAEQPSGLSAAFGGLRHRAGERLALPLYHRCLRRRGLRGRLPALPAGRPAGDDHGIRRGPCVPQQHGAGPEGPAARGHALAHVQQDPPVGQLPALHVLHHGHGLDAGLLLAQLFRQPFRSGHCGRGVLFRQHPGQPLRTGAGHDHRGGRGLPGLRHGRAEGRGARGQGHHGSWCCWWSAV